MKRTQTLSRGALALAGLVGLAGVACGGGDETGMGAGDAAMEKEATDVAAPAAEATSSETAPASAAQTCLELAKLKEWKEALEPCEEAAVERPDDLALQHALQQAQAAAAE